MQDTNAEQIQTIAQEYFDSRPNKDVSHKKLAVFFIACPGSGKSSLRAQIVAQLNATYVCNDEVRTILSERGLPAELLRPIVRKVWGALIPKLLINLLFSTAMLVRRLQSQTATLILLRIITTKYLWYCLRQNQKRLSPELPSATELMVVI